jgi:hypothetical protein
MAIVIDILGWIASVLIVGAYFLNIRGKWSAQSKWYILCNLVGGAFFIINTAYHGAYPSALVNVVWVIIAVFSLLKLVRNTSKAGKEQ